MTLVSIITPSFNQVSYLEQTIQSVLNQDYADIEYLVIDGASTDGSAEIIKKHASRFAYWVSEKDSGQADAINKGMARAKGEIVAWLNSDDVFLDEHVVSDIVAAFAPGVDIVTAAGWYLTEGGSRIHRIPVYPERLSYDVLRCVDWVLQPATFFRRELMRIVEFCRMAENGPEALASLRGLRTQYNLTAADLPSTVKT